MAYKSQQELYNDFITELQSRKPELTDVEEGSIIDVIAGSTSIAVSELTRVIVEEFKKTYFETANGPEITGGPDDLERLALDHYGDEFFRPSEVKASGTVTFSRPTTGAGNVVIPAGTIIKTPPNALGESQRFETVSEVTITGLTVDADVDALIAGPEGNVLANKVTVIETTLGDATITVNNASAFGGGKNAETDAEYRETIRRLITRIRGGSKEAVEAAALAVAGVENATAVEFETPVIEYDIGNDDILAGAEFFRIPYTSLYIADVNGAAGPSLIADVEAAIESVRAYGVYIKVLGAVPVSLDWSANITLNPSGPNYAEFVSDATKIEESMVAYINSLAIGADFVVASANAAMLAIWGPSGTNDLTDFDTVVPVGDVSTTAEEKIVAGTVGVL